MNEARIYWGELLHTRSAPVLHRFRYPHASFYCNIEEIAALCEQSKLLSHEALNFVSFHREDFLPSAHSLKETVAQHILDHDGHVFAGKIYLLANWRSMGLIMNPIALFYCFEADVLTYVVVEVHNTPWDERHVYVVKLGQQSESSSEVKIEDRLETKKRFHVSPFMPMETQYLWRLPVPGQTCQVEIAVRQQQKIFFRARLNLGAESFSARSVKSYCLRYPLMAGRTMLHIYWQALVLYLKRVPFFSHPNLGKMPEP
jgi:uncharacterized protein